MPFLTTLDVSLADQQFDGGRQIWRLDSPLVYHRISTDTTYTVPAGFHSDFSSVPRLPFAYWLTGDHAHLAAVVHDWLYVTAITDKPTADAIFLDAMSETGVVWWRRHAMYTAVRLFGRGKFNKNGEQNVGVVDDSVLDASNEAVPPEADSQARGG